MRNKQSLVVFKDFKKHIRKNILKRVISFVLLEILLGMILLFFGNTLFRTEVKVFQYSCYLLVVLVPFAITGVPFKLIDRSYCGRVEKVEIKTTYDNKTPLKPTLENTYTKNTIYLSIRCSDGNLIRKKAYEGPAKLQQHLDTYQVGDFVFHLYGSKYTVVLPNKKQSHVQCLICGCANDKTEDTCRNCGGLLLKEDTLPFFMDLCK